MKKRSVMENFLVINKGSCEILLSNVDVDRQLLESH